MAVITEALQARHALPAPSRKTRSGAVFVAGVAAGALLVKSDVSVAFAIARAATFGGALVAIGASLFTVFVDDGIGTSTERAQLRRVIGVAAVVAVFATLAQLPLQVVSVAGRGASGVTDRSVIGTVLRSRLHLATAVRLSGLVLLVYGADRWTERAVTATIVAVTGVLVATSSFLVTGHPSTRDPRLLAVVVDVAHVLSASVWVGGLVCLAIVLRQRRGAADTTVAVGVVVTRYSAAMAVTLAFLLASALALTLIQIGWAGLATPYGAVVLAKSGLVAAALGIGAYNHRRLVPAVAAGAPDGPSVLKRTVSAELALLAGVIVLTGILTGMATR